MILEMLLFIYLAVTLSLFLVFVIKGYNVTVTNKNTDVKIKVNGLNRLLIITGMCFIWPIILIQNVFSN